MIVLGLFQMISNLYKADPVVDMYCCRFGNFKQSELCSFSFIARHFDYRILVILTYWLDEMVHRILIFIEL